MKELGRSNFNVLAESAKMTGDWVEAFHRSIEEFDIDEADEILAFCQWMENSHVSMGFGNYESRFKEFQRESKSVNTNNVIFIDDKEPSLEELYQLIGTDMIQVLGSPDGKADIVVDEEGKLKNKTVNVTATAYWLGTEDTSLWQDVIVGTAVILKHTARLT